jgi:O-antigen chain-terminating methyltransferase
VTAEEDPAASLAEEIRAAVAEAAPARTAARTVPAGFSSLEDIGKPLERAEAHLTPVIPPGAPLARIKRLAVRAGRFLWRDQASFNALSLEAMNGLRQAAAEALETLTIQLGDLRREVEERQKATERAVAELDRGSKRRAAIQDGRIARLEEGAPSPAASSSPAAPAGEGLPPGLYSLFEERFRGSPEEVASRQADYLELLRGVSGPVLDVGSGRGEFLRLLRDRGIAARGIEINPLSVAAARQDGLDVAEGDALEVLAGTASGSAGAVVAFQVVEHWPSAVIYRFLREALRVLAPGGVLILETINTDSLSALRAFFLDPTHVRPVPPEALEFLAGAAGFIDSRVEYRSPLPDPDRLAEITENDAKLNRLLFAPQDYALIARAPEAPA